MSFLSVLKTIGKDLSHVGTWIDDGLKALEPVVGVLDPPLGPIFEEIESIIEGLQTPSAALIQAITTSVTTLEAIKSSKAITITIPAAGAAS